MLTATAVLLTANGVQTCKEYGMMASPQVNSGFQAAGGNQQHLGQAAPSSAVQAAQHSTLYKSEHHSHAIESLLLSWCQADLLMSVIDKAFVLSVNTTQSVNTKQ